MSWLWRPTGCIPRRRAAFAAIALLSAPVLLSCRAPLPILAVGAGELPDRVVLNLGEPPCRAMNVTWRTATTVETGLAQLAVATAAPDLDAAARRVEATSQDLELAQSDWNDAVPQSRVRYHSARLTALEPATPYAYRVGSEDGPWSEWHQFRTPPCTDDARPATTDAPGAAEAREDAAFRFLYFGDLQNGILSHGARVVRTAYAAAPDAAFALYAGDLVNDGHYDGDWAEWFAAGGWVHASLPVVPVVGNHEVRALDRARQGDPLLSIHWRAQFALPEVAELPRSLHETVYSFDVGAARFFVLNTSFGQDEQAPWITRELQRAVDEGVRWKIVSFHFPTFSNAPQRDNPELRAFVRPLFARAGVDLVLQGHDHSYGRGRDVGGEPAAETGAQEAGEQTGPVYVISVAGAKQYELEPSSWIDLPEDGPPPRIDRMAENSQLYQVVEVDGLRLSYRAYTADGELYDGFELLAAERPGGAVSKSLRELPATLPETRSFETTAIYRDDHWSR